MILERGKRSLAILIDPEKFSSFEGYRVNKTAFAKAYIEKLPSQTATLLVGGSTDLYNKTNEVVNLLKDNCNLYVILFPGGSSQLSERADGILFLSLLSGNNPEYLIGQQVKAASRLKKMQLKIIPTGYLLIDGGQTSAVARVSNTKPLKQSNIDLIVNTALAGQYLGMQCIYLEAGSGAKKAVNTDVISAVKAAINIPLIVGGGIRCKEKMNQVYAAGADMVVIGTAFEENTWKD